MSLLKSAWEIALEKTEGIEADPEKIRKDNLIGEGRRLAGTYLTDIEADGKSFEKGFKSVKAEDKPLVRQGIASTVLLNVALPQSPDFTERLEKMHHIVEIIDGPESDTAGLIGQIGQFMGKYFEARESLLERAHQQYKPMYEQKREQMMQKYGKAPSMSMDQDPEFVQMLQRNYTQLSNQYQEVLDQAKDQLKQVWGIED
ncbi:DUF6657 family protein [Pleomorphochaeta sp. DL1XJH-081]|jgi:hypothetical protein|uniref:DUF6657 family protein n=1 Tax=Pleomorphochaeta sp. DL1XJH-081 TaxID=3409690 RepID=UPI003BB7D539